MSIHYFHCTDGVDLIVDRRGRDTRAKRDTRVQARSVAADIMRALPAYDEWSAWAVHVYDARGQVEIVPFTEPVQPAKRPTAPRPSRQVAQASAA
jgi:hypothetical protein